MKTGSVVAAWGESVCCGFVKKLVVGLEKDLNKETVRVCVVGAWWRKKDLFGRKEKRDIWTAIKMKTVL